MRIEEKYSKCFTPLNIYLFISLSGIILFFIAAFFEQTKVFDWIMMENNSDWVTSDYFRHVHHSQYLSNIYHMELDAYFPPMAYIFYCFIYRISFNGYLSDDYRDMLTEPYQIIIFIMYTLIAVVWLGYIFDELNISITKRRLLFFSVVFSVPVFAGALERGNMALYVIVIILNALILKDSDQCWKREASLILIAIAAGLKVYPAVLGLLYIKEKRRKEAIRLIIYGILCFFMPFIFFGGLGGLLAYIKKLIELMSREYFGRIQFFKGLMSFTLLSNEAISILNFLFIMGLLVAIIFTKNKLYEMIYFASFMAFVPGNAYRYTLIYFLIIVFTMFRDFDGENRTDISIYVFSIVLGSLFSIPTLMGVITGFKLNFGIYTYTYVERYIYTLAWGILVYAIIIEVYNLFKNCLIVKWKS